MVIASEIVVVDDGSRDGTWRAMTEASALAWLPLGAQYVVAARKPAEETRWTSKHSRPSSSATATPS